MVDVMNETPRQVHAKLCRVFSKATVCHEGMYVWREVSEPPSGFPLDGILAYVKGQLTSSVLVPSPHHEPDRLHVTRINFTSDQDNSGFGGWLATLLKSKLGTGVAVVCGYESANGGVFDYWCIPEEISVSAVKLLETWQQEDPPDLHSLSHMPANDDQGRSWLRLPITVETEDAHVQVREAQALDIDVVVALIADESLRGTGKTAADNDASDRYQDALTRMRQDPHNMQLVIEDPHAQIVGCVQVTLIPGLFRGGASRVHLEAIRIALPQRSRRLGTNCVRAIIDGVSDPTVQGVQLMSDLRRVDAIRFYERLGFVASHRRFKLTLAGDDTKLKAGAASATTEGRTRPRYLCADW